LLAVPIDGLNRGFCMTLFLVKTSGLLLLLYRALNTNLFRSWSYNFWHHLMVVQFRVFIFQFYLYFSYEKTSLFYSTLKLNYFLVSELWTLLHRCLLQRSFFLKKYIQINLDLVTFKKCYRMEEYRIDDVHCFMLGGRFELIASIWNAKINDNVQLNTFNVDYLLSFIFELFQSCVCFRQSNI